MPERATCNLCGSGDARELFRLADYRLWVDDVEWPVVQCRHCGLAYLNPRPSRAEIGRYYPARYFAHRGLADAHERYRRLARFVPPRPGRLLDIGTATGDFLALMREQGWEVEGIEPSDAPNRHGLTIHRYQFPEKCPLPDESFDVITAWAVFEHLHDPAGAFRESARMLRGGGQLVIQVPNLHSIASRVALQEDVPRHLHFFSEPVLRRYGDRVGLRLVEVVHTTDLFGGSGRGVLQLWLVRALGGTPRDYFRVMSLPARERLRCYPVATLVLAAVKRLESVLLPDVLVRALRISGQIVARYVKTA